VIGAGKKRFPVLLGRMPAKIHAGEILLRRSSFHDLAFVRDNLDECFESCSAFRCWWRLRSVFAFLYIVEISGRPAGIFGISRFEPGISAEVSLALFDKTLRRLGYGREIISLASEMLLSRARVRQLLVTVEPENHAALSFWQGLGFQQAGTRGGNAVLSLDLNQAPVPPLTS